MPTETRFMTLELGAILPNGIITCSDINMLPAACCTLLSFHRNLSNADVRLLLMTIDVDARGLADIAAFCEVHGITIEVLPYTASDALQKTAGRWSQATLARLFMDDFVPADLDRLLYVDADVMSVAAVDGLLDSDLHGHALAAVDDYLMAFPEKARQRELAIGLTEGPRYFNAGVLLFDWRKCLGMEALKKARALYQERSGAFPSNDQDVLNIVFSGNWLPLDPSWNTQTGMVPYVKAARIVHFTGRKKPWNSPVPWIHRRMKERYIRDLAATPWPSFCSGIRLSEVYLSFIQHVGKQIGNLARLSQTRAYFGS